MDRVAQLKRSEEVVVAGKFLIKDAGKGAVVKLGKDPSPRGGQFISQMAHRRLGGPRRMLRKEGLEKKLTIIELKCELDLASAKIRALEKEIAELQKK